jgi:hypothetical protein
VSGNKTTTRGFGAAPPVIAAARGFGSKPATKQMAPPSSPPTKSSGLEEVIQKKIAANAGLREVLTLQRELEQFELVTRSLNEMQIATQFSPSVASSMKTKASRLRELREQGWSVKSVHNKLNEITVSLLTSLKALL